MKEYRYQDNRELENKAMRNGEGPKPKLHPDAVKRICRYFSNTRLVEDLANAVIVQACDDYRVSKRRLERNPQNKEAAEAVIEIEQFFRSDWFEMLTKLDGEWLLAKLRAECRNQSSGQ